MSVVEAVHTTHAGPSRGRGAGSLRALLADVAAAVADFDPSLLTGREAAVRAEEFAAIERLAGAGKTLATGRVAETGAHRLLGADTVEHWLAAHTKVSPWEAGKTVETARHLAADELDLAAAAFRRGDLTPTQANEIATAASVAPEMQGELLASARRDTLKTLKDKCKAVRLSRRKPEDPDTRNKRIKEAMRFGHTDDGDGLSELRVTMPTSWFVKLLFTVREQCEMVFAQARKDGRNDPHQVYMVEALMALVCWGNFNGFAPPDGVTPTDDTRTDDATTDADRPPGRQAPPSGDHGHDVDIDVDVGNDADGETTWARPPASGPDAPGRCPGESQLVGRARPPRVKIICRVDLDALKRGFATTGETCDIAGVGPVSVATLRELFPESVVAVVLTKGVEVRNVTHLGRRATAAMYTAMQWEVALCTNIECDHGLGIETDHSIGWAETHRTRLDELDPLCGSRCHKLKTEKNWALVSGTGRRRFVPPDHPDHPRNATAPAP